MIPFPFASRIKKNNIVHDTRCIYLSFSELALIIRLYRKENDILNQYIVISYYDIITDTAHINTKPITIDNELAKLDVASSP